MSVPKGEKFEIAITIGNPITSRQVSSPHLITCNICFYGRDKYVVFFNEEELIRMHIEQKIPLYDWNDQKIQFKTAKEFATWYLNF